MAVQASSQISIVDVSDGATGATGKGVKSVTPEYYLSSSKTTQVDGSWSTTPPTWSNDKYLWVRQLVTYTDSTTSRTQPYCDTAWEAVNEIRVGGRNLFFNSSFHNDPDKWSPRILSNGVESIFDLKFVTKHGKKCAYIHSSNLNERIIVGQGILDKVESNTTYTFSGWVLTENIVKGTTDYFARFHIDGAYNNNNSLLFYMYGYDAEFAANSGEGNWEYLSYTFTTDKDKLGAAVSLSAYVYARDLTGDIYFCDLKLEKGNKATDWTPAPEDIDDAIDNIDVGGVNLLRNTNDMSKYIKSNVVSIITDSEGFNVASFSELSPLTWPSIVVAPNILYSIIRNKEITLSFEYRSDNWVGNSGEHQLPVVSFGLNNGNDTDMSRPIYRSIYQGNVPTTEWQKYVLTVKLTDSFFTGGSSLDITDNTRFVIILFNHSTNSMQIRKMKLELGNKPTAWSMAPEDIAEDIADAKQTADDANDKATYSQAWIEENGDHLLFAVTDGNGNTTNMIQNGTGWTFSFDELDERLGKNSESITNSLTSLEQLIADNAGNIDSIGETVSKLSSNGNYVRVTEMTIDGTSQSVIVLGSEDSPFSLVISPTKILFTCNDSIPAHITNNELHIRNAYIDDELSFGSCSWKIHGDGNLGLSWED